MRSRSWRPVDNETPSGVLDGINATFTLAFTPIRGAYGSTKRGLRIRPGADHDYTIKGRLITFHAGAASTLKF